MPDMKYVTSCRIVINIEHTTSPVFVVFTVAHNCHGKRINLTAKEKPKGKQNNLAAKRITSRQK